MAISSIFSACDGASFGDIQRPQPGDSLKKKLEQRERVHFRDVYKLGDKINEGAFGVVYKAYHVNDPNIIFAVKIQNNNSSIDIDNIVLDINNTTANVNDDSDSDNDDSESDDYDDMIREVSIMRELVDIPNVIQIIDFYADEKKMYAIQTFAKGGDVFDRLTSKKHNRYDEKDVYILIQNLLQIVESLHNRSIIHRDLKPENLLLKDTASDTDIYLCDFGYAKMLPPIISSSGDHSDDDDDDDDDGKLSTFVGTPEYVAPEIVEGKSYRGEVDVWSIGCIAYTLLSGSCPFGLEDDNDLLYDDIIEANYDFEDKCWKNITDNAKKFVTNLLTTDQNDRWTILQAKQFNWFDNDTNIEEEEEVTNLEVSSLPTSSSNSDTDDSPNLAEDLIPIPVVEVEVDTNFVIQTTPLVLNDIVIAKEDPLLLNASTIITNLETPKDSTINAISRSNDELKNEPKTNKNENFYFCCNDNSENEADAWNQLFAPPSLDDDDDDKRTMEHHTGLLKSKNNNKSSCYTSSRESVTETTWLDDDSFHSLTTIQHDKGGSNDGASTERQKGEKKKDECLIDIVVSADCQQSDSISTTSSRTAWKKVNDETISQQQLYEIAAQNHRARYEQMQRQRRKNPFYSMKQKLFPTITNLTITDLFTKCSSEVETTTNSAKSRTSSNATTAMMNLEEEDYRIF